MHRLLARTCGVTSLIFATVALGMPVASAIDPSPTPSPTPSSSATSQPSDTPSPSPTSASPSPSSPSPAPSSSTPAPTTTAPSTSPTESGPESPAPSTRESKTSPFAQGSEAALIPGTASERAGFAAGFLDRTLKARGNHYTFPGSDFFDGGNTIDAILGLYGAKAGGDRAAASLDYLKDNVGTYVGTDYDSVFAGATAKTALAAYVGGADPNNFGGHTLIDTLLNDSLGAVEPGRFSDLPVDCGDEQCDYSNTVGQSLAVIAIGRAQSAVPDAAMEFLLRQQCDDGGFRVNPDAEACVSDNDATAFAAQALVGRYEADNPATVQALAYLKAQQRADGSLLNADGQPNTNTTGVAAQAFAAAGYLEELAKAQSFIASLQFGCDADPSLRGGIAMTSTDYAALEKSPTDDKNLDIALRATPQATLGLAGGSLLEVTDETVAAGSATVACQSAAPTSTPPPSSAPASGSPRGGVDSAGDATPAPAADGGRLADTGASLGRPLLIALVLLAIGVVALLLVRRRGKTR